MIELAQQFMPWSFAWAMPSSLNCKNLLLSNLALVATPRRCTIPTAAKVEQTLRMRYLSRN